ncbi:MAG: hypothetical protein EBQ80_06040 [Proteobacteria bacterium]|nr:hypothetical protein [Pseudomonadota bacterium]
MPQPRRTAPAPRPIFKPRNVVMLAALLLFAARLAYLQWLSPYGLAPDEAQYWSWLMHPAASYLTKPPLTTWLMGLSTGMLGHTLIGVKIFAIASQSFCAVLGFLIAEKLAQTAQFKTPHIAGYWAFALLATTPILAAGGLIMSPDALLLPLWLTATLLAIHLTHTHSTKLSHWLLLGLIIGLAGLAKYTAALFFPLFALYFIIQNKHLVYPLTRASVNPLIRLPILPFLAAGTLALALQTPVIWWNATHGAAGLAHVAWQTDGGGDTRHGGLLTLLDFLAAQALIIGPLAFPLAIAALIQLRHTIRKNPSWLLLATLALPIFLLFTAMNLLSKVQPNWPLLGSIPLLLFLALFLAQNPNKWLHRTAIAALVINTILSVMLMDTNTFRAAGLLPLKAKLNPTKDLLGWPELAPQLQQTLAKCRPKL